MKQFRFSVRDICWVVLLVSFGAMAYSERMKRQQVQQEAVRYKAVLNEVAKMSRSEVIEAGGQFKLKRFRTNEQQVSLSDRCPACKGGLIVDAELIRSSTTDAAGNVVTYWAETASCQDCGKHSLRAIPLASSRAINKWILSEN